MECVSTDEVINVMYHTKKKPKIIFAIVYAYMRHKKRHQILNFGSHSMEFMVIKSEKDLNGFWKLDSKLFSKESEAEDLFRVLKGVKDI